MKKVIHQSGPRQKTEQEVQPTEGRLYPENPSAARTSWPLQPERRAQAEQLRDMPKTRRSNVTQNPLARARRSNSPDEGDFHDDATSGFSSCLVFSATPLSLGDVDVRKSSRASSFQLFAGQRLFCQVPPTQHLAPSARETTDPIVRASVASPSRQLGQMNTTATAAVRATVEGAETHFRSRSTLTNCGGVNWTDDT